MTIFIQPGTERHEWRRRKRPHESGYPQEKETMPAFTSIKAKAIGIAVDQGVNMLYDDFDGNLPKVESLINKFAGSGDSINDAQLRLFNMVMGYMKDPTNNWRRLVDNIINNVDKDVVKTFVHNFFVNSVTIGGARQREVNDTEGCNCPWAILMDPTSALQPALHRLLGGRATATPSHKDLTFEELDAIVTQGNETWARTCYLFTGGEPMVRKKDLIRLCEAHTALRVLGVHERHAGGRGVRRRDAAGEELRAGLLRGGLRGVPRTPAAATALSPPS